MYHDETPYRRKLFSLKKVFKVGDTIKVVSVSDQGSWIKPYLNKVGIILSVRPKNLDYSSGERFYLTVLVVADNFRMEKIINLHVLDLEKLGEANVCGN